jgi:hypothetical protein
VRERGDITHVIYYAESANSPILGYVDRFDGGGTVMNGGV